MTDEFTLSEMMSKVSKFFVGEGFSVEPYSQRLYNIRLPLYCCKTGGAENTEPVEQIVVDIITETRITKDDYMPDKLIDGCAVTSASSVKFFQYYLPEAKVFWAYGHYVDDNAEDFKNFKQCCIENGIGLLKVCDDGIDKATEALSLNEVLRNRVKDGLAMAGSQDQDIIDAMSRIIADHQDEYIQHLVYYGEPRFLRRAITVRKEDMGLFLSMLLINRLENVQNVTYAAQLKKFVSEYRFATDEDHQIAFRVLKELWKDRFKVQYPDIQKDFEVVLLLDAHYRDHFLHQFQVFALGVLIIDGLYREPWVSKFEQTTGSKIEDAWLACSTYHDYNYPVQKWDQWMREFLAQNFHINGASSKYHLHQNDISGEIMRLNLGAIVVRDEFLDKMHRLSQGAGCACADYFERFLLRRITVDKNHAVLGAFTFLEKFQKCSNLSPSAIEAAGASILLHDEPNWQCFRGDDKALCECQYKKRTLCVEEKDLCAKPFLTHLTLDAMPLAFLLAFCDVAQEWGRKGERLKIEEPRLMDIQIDQGQILVDISVRDDASYDPKEKEITRLGRYLQDNRFKIKLASREGLRDTTVQMSGT